MEGLLCFGRWDVSGGLKQAALAYLGALAEHQTMSDTVADPVFARYVQRLWMTAIIPTVTAPLGVNLPDYAATLRQRFANPAIRHLTAQIAMDGSQKLRQRILGTWRDNHAAGRASPGLTLALAGWMRYIRGVDEDGQTFEVKDPLAARFRELSHSADTSADFVRAILGLSKIFDPAQAAPLQVPVVRAFDNLLTHGAGGAVQLLANTP